MENELTKLKAILSEVMDLRSALAVLDWDQQVNMPQGGTAGRGHALSTLAAIEHSKFTSEEVGNLLQKLEPLYSQLPPDSDDACLFRVTRHDYEKATRVPTQWVADFTQTAAISQSTWEQAKAESDFSRFKPQLEKIVELRRQYSSFFAPYEHVYDPLLDDFEPGLKTVDVKEIFTALRPEQVALVHAISQKPQVDDSFLTVEYPEKMQWDFGVEVISHFGFDWHRGRQDKSVHPFTSGFNTGDVRITTRFLQNRVASALFGSMHEAGHGLYELGIDLALDRTPLASGASMAIHESQSRMWENLVGRSRSFWVYFYPKLQQMATDHLGNVDLETFYRGINKVEPSLVRVEADEVTYNLHIMLRLELEIALMEGSLEVKDLPEAWNTRMKEYLGVVPPDDASGVLQDVHWSAGLFGYFPTYALGNLVSAQLWETILVDIPDLPQQFEKGTFHNLLQWLREKIHQHGAKFEPQDLIRRITGSKITPEPYLRYLKTKYSEIYGLL
jgi:carboxypeptidase Taq